MSFIVRVSVAISAAIFASSSSATDWYAFAPTAESAAFLQSDGIEVRGGVKTLWMLQVQYDSPNIAGGQSHRMRVRIDCEAQTAQSLNVMVMDKRRTLLAVDDEPTAPIRIPRGSILDSLQAVACKPNFPRDLGKDASLKKLDNPSDPYAAAVMFGLLQRGGKSR